MRLTRIEIRDYRSIFLDDSGEPLVLDLASGMNTLVGLNNCGKSNVLRAVSLALDPHHPFDPEFDAPGPRPFALPIITLRFQAEGARDDEQAVLQAAADYEAGLGASTTYAAAGTVVFEVAFQPTADGPRRRERLLTPDNATASTDQDFERLATAVAKLREAVRFVLISSGESIASVLEGNFREILHSVVRERLHQEFADADQSRGDYVRGLQDSLLAPLRDRLADDIGKLFPEIDAITLSPDVPSIERTLSNVGVELEDLVATPLDQKGTGVRAGVLVAMLSYLSLNATKGMVFAVEEPESFLHPAAQEDLRDGLETLAASTDVTLLVTTHSPYLVSRSNRGRVFCLAKDNKGRTRVGQSATGDTPHASLIGDLFRPSSLEELLARASGVPDGTKATLIVEGPGDLACLQLAAGIVGRPDLLDGMYIQPAGGASKTVTQALLARAATDLPVYVLLDNDEPGKEAQKLLTSKFGFQKNSEVATYAAVFPQHERDFRYEAEDLFDSDVLQTFVDTHGEAVIDGKERRPDGEWHVDLNQSAKELLADHLETFVRPEHVRRWIDLIVLLRERLGLDGQGTTDEILAAAPDVPIVSPSHEPGSTLIVTDELAPARYRSDGVLILDADIDLPADIDHVGFYAEAAIQPEIPTVIADYPGLLISEATAAQLSSSGRELDTRAAAIVGKLASSDQALADTTHRLYLLSAPDDPATLTLQASVTNTKERSGRRLAWTVGPKLVRTASLLKQPSTTDELDTYESEAAGASKNTDEGEP